MFLAKRGKGTNLIHDAVSAPDRHRHGVVLKRLAHKGVSMSVEQTLENFWKVSRAIFSLTTDLKKPVCKREKRRPMEGGRII